MEDFNEEKYNRAKKKVDAIKGFYSHLKAYIIVNLIIILVRSGFVPIIQIGETDLNFQNWFSWNLFFSVVLWGTGLLIHGLFVFQYKWKFLKKWEERKINEYMDKDHPNQ